MLKLILLAVTMLVSMIFLAVSDHYNGVMVGFVLVEGTIRIKEYTYYLWEYWILITMAWIILAEAKEHRFALKVFFGIQVADLVDFVLTFNNPWFGIPELSMNTFGMAIFSASIILSDAIDER